MFTLLGKKIITILRSNILHNWTIAAGDSKHHALTGKECMLATQHLKKTIEKQGAQWLSGRVLDSRPRGCGFEPHRRHCVVVLEQDTFILA